MNVRMLLLVMVLALAAALLLFVVIYQHEDDSGSVNQLASPEAAAEPADSERLGPAQAGLEYLQNHPDDSGPPAGRIEKALAGLEMLKDIQAERSGSGTEALRELLDQ